MMTRGPDEAVMLPFVGAFGKGQRAAFSSRRLIIRRGPEICLLPSEALAPTVPVIAVRAERGQPGADRGDEDA